MTVKKDIIIVGTGVSGLFAALSLPENKEILLISKSDVESSDSFLAQGGICVLRDKEDYDSYFEDTMKAGHYENRRESVEVMIRSSQSIIEDLIKYGVEFEKKDNHYLYTREGAHSKPRIMYHEDITGKEITSKLLAQVKKRKNITLLEYITMTDLIEKDGKCVGIEVEYGQKKGVKIYSDYTILASGGIGGRYKNSTNFSHLTGDAIEIAKKHGIKLEHLDYVQIHPTTLYSKKLGRRFLISESVRGEGAVLYNKDKQRFVNELLPRDLVTNSICEQMKKDGTDYVWLSMEHMDKETILKHFPNIYKHCMEEGYDVTKECIPVVPAQHYFMGGIWVDLDSRTSMDCLFAVGETSCNGVHGANRLASNSLLESLVFSKRAGEKISSSYANEKQNYRKENAAR
jgi:L-aspartate oxidase